MDGNLILICSDEQEGTTDLVCQWLNYYNKKFLRISKKDEIKINKIELLKENGVEIYFEINQRKFRLSEICSYWYRRSFLTFKKVEEVEYTIDGENINLELSNALKQEFVNVERLFLKILHHKAKLNTHFDNYINKLEALHLAIKNGLDIPHTQILTRKDDLTIEGEIISKAIGDLIFRTAKGNISLAPCEVEKEDLQENFFYSCFQKRIQKKYELRIFYAFDIFFTTAIFSQKNEKTKLDFRNYDYDFPNRVVPYKLPFEIEQKLRQLMKDLKLKSGSIDMVLTCDNNFVFLEVNPVGQFEQVSFPANYNLHQLIAQRL